jgi:hypothetical protein
VARPTSHVRVEDSVIITCAASDALAGRGPCPATAYTPAECADEARGIAGEGGAAGGVPA